MSSPRPESFDSRAFRHSLGMFATGVTVVTMEGADGRRIGLTVNSFSSVSLEPPLVLWSLARDRPWVDDFVACSHFAINVLAADQTAISHAFATRDATRFEGIETTPGLGGAPLLDGCCAWFECSNAIQHDGGDHLIFIGQVERFRREMREPLVYFGGHYRALA